MRKATPLILLLYTLVCTSKLGLPQSPKSTGDSERSQSKSKISGPALKDTLEFLKNSIEPGIAVKIACDDMLSSNNYWFYSISKYQVETSKFPLLGINVTFNQDENKSDTVTSSKYLIHLERLDPQRIRAEDQSGLTSRSNCNPQHLTTYVVTLEGTNNQAIFDSPLEDNRSRFEIRVSSKEMADRIVAALKHAVDLAGGKPSAF